MKAISRYLCLFILVVSCKQEGERLSEADYDKSSPIRLEKIQPDVSGISFDNQLSDQGNLNVFVWNFLYTGSGVATGDINNDGLPDIYFGGNQVPDRLYLNKGDFRFEDISAKSPIQDNSWTTGVTMADVNADGLLDIYVCKNSPTLNRAANRNKLFVNLGDGQFSEQAAAYGIADEGFSIQGTFFDADQDGDIDLYLINQPPDQLARLIHSPDDVMAYPVTDRFYRNENGVFVDRTTEMEMEDDRYGLGISLGDFDGNGWTDIYLCNDYTQADMLYMNREGRFMDELRSRTGHISYYSMGSDAGDVNNDGWEDVFVLDMAFEDHYRAKTNMESMRPELFWSLVEAGQHYPYAQNTLQLNKGDGFFSEVGQMAGLSKSDWSWAALFADLDQDGRQDILVTNGILRDMKNNDFTDWVKQTYQGRVGPANYLDVLAKLPSSPVANKIYRNTGELSFDDIARQAGFGEPGFSHGLAYADFDGDGSLDVVVNNLNAPASIYRNISPDKGNYLTLTLTGAGLNIHALGTPVVVCAGAHRMAATVQTTRGYYSASVPELHFGLGDAQQADSILVYWNAKAMTVLKAVPANQTLHLAFDEVQKVPFRSRTSTALQLTEAEVLPFEHMEVSYNDYSRQVLLPHKLSQNGPFMAFGDVNGDGIEDLYIGGAAGQPGALLIQQTNAAFTATLQPALIADKGFEDQQSAFLDIDGDGDLDLYVVSGSNEFSEGSEMLQDRVYLNDGRGRFARSEKALPGDLKINGQCLAVADFDGDGDSDIFLGGRLVSGRYPLAGRSTFLRNESGILLTADDVGDLRALGMVTDATAADFDLDGDPDILVVGEWMAPTILINDDGTFKTRVLDDPGVGLWWSVAAGDFDADGDTDLILGNLGWNQKFGGRHPKLSVYAGDFDQNGDHDVVLAKQVGDIELPYRGRECSSEEMPSIAQRFPSYDAFANAELKEILGEERLKESVHLKIQTLSSVYLRNDGDLQFVSTDLPVAVQSGPVKACWIEDVDRDGNLDFIFAGNHFPAEVETARYDGLLHGICFGNGSGQFLVRILTALGHPLTGDYRDVRVIEQQGRRRLLLAQNNGPLISYALGH